MKKIMLLTLLISTPGWSDGNPPPKPAPAPRTQAHSDSSALAIANAQSDSVAKAEGGYANARAEGGSATSHGGTASVGDIDLSGPIDASTSISTYREAASTAVAGYGNTTASCFRTYGLGGSTRDSGWSLGVPFKDRDCALSEAAALAFANGNTVAGWRMYCHQSQVKRVYGAKRRFFGPKGAGASHIEAVKACLQDATNIQPPHSEVALALQILSDEQNRLLQEFHDHQRTTEARIVNVERVAHPQGKGLTVKRVREIVQEEAPCAVAACASTKLPTDTM